MAAIDAFVITEVEQEMDRARAKHGPYSLDGSRMTDILRLAALMEETGEVARCLTYDQDHSNGLRKELIQVASVALTWATIIPREKDTDNG